MVMGADVVVTAVAGREGNRVAPGTAVTVPVTVPVPLPLSVKVSPAGKPAAESVRAFGWASLAETGKLRAPW